VKVLLLGGTSESRAIAAAAPAGVTLVESWAGRLTTLPAPAPDRVGGFGGPDGLAAYLRAESIDAVVDATHPFAARMTRHAALACANAGVPLLRVSRPSWVTHPLAATWTWVADHPAAADAARSAADAPPRGGSRGLLTVGRQPLPHYLDLPDVVARVAEPPDAALPPGWELVVARGPFAEAGERALLQSRGVGVLVTKDAGGPAAKLDAAAALGVAVVVVRRPDGPAGVPEVPDAAGALAWLAALAGQERLAGPRQG